MPAADDRLHLRGHCALPTLGSAAAEGRAAEAGASVQCPGGHALRASVAQHEDYVCNVCGLARSGCCAPPLSSFESNIESPTSPPDPPAPPAPTMHGRTHPQEDAMAGGIEEGETVHSCRSSAPAGHDSMNASNGAAFSRDHPLRLTRSPLCQRHRDMPRRCDFDICHPCNAAAAAAHWGELPGWFRLQCQGEVRFRRPPSHISGACSAHKRTRH